MFFINGSITWIMYFFSFTMSFPQDEFLGGCVIQQTVSQESYCSYKFPPNYVLRGGAMVTVSYRIRGHGDGKLSH